MGFVLLALGLNAQDISSPFSAYGLGKLYGQNISSQLQAMGGIYLIRPLSFFRPAFWAILKQDKYQLCYP